MTFFSLFSKKNIFFRILSLSYFLIWDKICVFYQYNYEKFYHLLISIFYFLSFEIIKHLINKSNWTLFEVNIFFFYLLQQLFSNLIIFEISNNNLPSNMIVIIQELARKTEFYRFIRFEIIGKREKKSRDRGCFASLKQQGGDVLEILFSTTVSLTNGYSTFRSCIVHAEYVSRKDRGNGNGPRLRRKPPTQYSSALRFSTRFRINFCSIPNIYKEFYWNVSRLSTYPRQPSYPPSSSTLFVFSCWCAILPPVPRALCQSSFHFD